MIRSIVPFKRFHYDWILEVGEPVDFGAFKLNRQVLDWLETQNTYTAVVDGTPIAIAGTWLMWPGRHTAWAHMTQLTAPYMLWLTQATLKNLETLQGRVELTVRTDFPAGQRWAKLLGFHVENPPGLLRAFGPEGEDHIAYVRMS